MFTILTPRSNKAASIERMLDSVYAQLCQPGGILVATDGATDGSDAIIRGRPAKQMPCGVVR